MPVINRFSKQQELATFQPLSFEQMMFTPSGMRAEHDALAETAATNMFHEMDVLSQDEQVANDLYRPIEQEFESVTNELAKSGFSPDKKDRVLNLIGKKKQIEQQYISKLQQRKQQYQDTVAQIKDFYKENPEAANNTLRRLQKANEGAAVFDEQGKLNVPGIKGVFYSEILGSKDIVDITNAAFDQLKPYIQSQLPQYAGNLDSFTKLFSSPEISSVTKDRIKQRLYSIIGSDVRNSMKMEGILGGLEMNPEYDTQWKEEFINNVLPEHIKDKFLLEQFNNNPKLAQLSGTQRNAEIQRLLKEYENSDEYGQKLAQAVSNASNKSASDLYADYAVDNLVEATASSMAYSQIKNQNYLRDDKAALELLKNKNQGFSANWTSIEVPSSNYALPNPDTLNFDDNGKLYSSTVASVKPIESNNYTYTNSEGEEVSADEALSKVEFTKTGTPYQFVKEGYTASNNHQAQLNKTISDLKSQIPYFSGKTDKQIYEDLQKFEKNSRSAIHKAIDVNEDDGDLFRQQFLGYRDGQNNIVLPRNAGTSTYSLAKGEADQTLYNVVDELGYDSIDQLIQVGGLSGGKFVPTIGKFVAQALDSDGQVRNIYISPDEGLWNDTELFRKVSDGITSYTPYTKLFGNQSADVYLLNDFNSGQAYIVGMPSDGGKVDYNTLLQQKELNKNNPSIITDAGSFLTRQVHDKLLNNPNYTKYLNID